MLAIVSIVCSANNVLTHAYSSPLSLLLFLNTLYHVMSQSVGTLSVSTNTQELDSYMLNKNTQGAKKGEANQKQQLSSR